MKHVSTAIAIFIVVVTGAAGQWVKQPNAPQGRVIASSFVNAGVGVAVGYNDNPTLWSTADSGKTWVDWEADTNYRENGLRSIGLSKHGTGWAVGPLGVFRTTDFGQTWTNDSLALPDTLRNRDPRWYYQYSSVPIWSAIEVSQDWAFISGCRESQVVSCRRSVHKDSVWNIVPAISGDTCRDNPNEEGYTTIRSAMSPDGVGFLTTWRSAIYSTRDSGYTWSFRSDYQTNRGVNYYDFVDSLNGRSTSGMYTSDGGRTWKSTRDGAPSGCSSICYVDTLCGWISDYFFVYMTRDAGRSWEPQLQREYAFTFNIVDDKYIYSLGSWCFWKADYRSLCDSITSSLNDAPVPPNNLTVVVLGTTLTLAGDVPYDAGPVELMITDLVGRTMLKRDVQRDAEQQSISVDVADVPCGTYIVALSTARSASSQLIMICP